LVGEGAVRKGGDRQASEAACPYMRFCDSQHPFVSFRAWRDCWGRPNADALGGAGTSDGRRRMATHRRRWVSMKR
jgi:hypothetical protein